jgi:hypothetical protein
MGLVDNAANHFVEYITDQKYVLSLFILASVDFVSGCISYD